MADLARIKRNVEKMASQSAPEADIDGYIASEGVTIDDVRGFKAGPAAPQAPQPQFEGGMAGAGALGAADTMSFGFGDELGAGLGAASEYIASKFTGEKPRSYDELLGKIRDQESRAQQTNPGSFMAGQIGGALAGGAGLAKGGLSLTGRAMDAGFRLPTVAGISAVEGAGLGALHGAGTGEEGTRAQGATQGALYGLAGGAVAPVAAAGISKALGGAMNRSAFKEIAKNAPSRVELKATTDKLYGVMRQAGISYDAPAFGQTVQSARDEMLKIGLRPSVANEAFAYLDDLTKMQGAPDFDDINGLVQTVGGAARAADRAGQGPLAKAYGIIRDKLDDFEQSAPLTSAAGIPRDQLNRVRQVARQTALKNIKARTLDSILGDAETYQSGLESGIRNQVGSLLRSSKGKQLFSGAERTALLQVSQGRKPLQALSKFGFDLSSLGGNASLIPTLGAVGAGAGFGPAVGAGLAAAGTAAKFVSPRMTQAALEKAAAAIRSGKLDKATFQNQLSPANRKLLSMIITSQGASASGRLGAP